MNTPVGPYGVANSGWQRNSRPRTKEIARAPGRRLARHQAEPEHPGRRARRVEDLETAAVLPDRAAGIRQKDAVQGHLRPSSG